MDTRRAQSDGRYPVRIAVSKNKFTFYIGTGINLKSEHWSKSKSQCIGCPEKTIINQVLRKHLLDVQTLDFEAQLRPGYSRLSAESLKSILAGSTSNSGDGSFIRHLDRFIKDKSKGTKSVYLQTRSRLSSYLERYGIASPSFDDITCEWLRDFEKYLSETAPSRNARNIHFRNMRAVFNDAITEGLTESYPFRKFKIKAAPTAKRSLSVERLRELFAYPCEEHQKAYIDIFKLIFFLCGINAADLCHLKEITDGRIEYDRAKTHRHYSVKVEPEALEIIERHRGKGWLLDILDRYENYTNYVRRIDRTLQHIGEVEIVSKHGKKEVKAAFPGLTTYWARHSWATTAASLDIPKEVIAAGLGHGATTVTDIYIDFDLAKVDRANRMVIDWVLYGKKERW